MSEFEKRQAKIIKEFNSLSNWEDRYKQIIQLGKSLPPMDQNLMTEDNKVKGCQSQVWIFAKLTPDGKIEFVADSDAMIVKGLVSLLVRAYSGLSPSEILANKPTFISELGFEKHLSPSRANGFLSMVKQMNYYAQAYEALLKTKV